MAILQPLVALAAWTMVMWVWLYATRIPAMNAAKIDPDSLVGANAPKLDAILPPQVSWVAQNYNHLHEAPTVFYAVVLALALLESGSGAALWLAWAYVALRVVHSLVQATVNKVMLRWALFMASMLVQGALIVLAGQAVLAG